MIKHFFCLCCMLLMLKKVFSQQTGLPLKTVLGQLEQQHQITISYDVAIADKITVSAIPTDNLQAQLDYLAEQTGLSFAEADGGVFLMKTVAHDLCIRVLDDTGRPLELAQIVLNNQTTSITTDVEGYARFESKLTFQDTFKIHYFGFKDKSMIVRELVEKECATVQLTFATTTLKEVVITNYITSGIDFSKEDNSLRIRTEDLALLPGETDGDILLAIRTLPGISSPNGKAGNLHIRGGTTDQTLVLFDNIPIYHKGHYYGTISPYNPVAVDEVKVFRSGYGPDLGGRIGGAIRLESPKAIPDSARFGVGLNTFYGSAFAEVPVNQKLGINAAIRSTYHGEWQSPKLKALSDLALQTSIAANAEDNPNQEVLEDSFTFYDANFNANHKINDGLVSLSFLTIDNSQDTRILDTVRNSTQESKSDLNNIGLNLDWLQYWSPKFSTTSSAAYSEYQVDLLITQNLVDRPAFIPNQFEQRILDLYFNTAGNIQLNGEQESSLRLGYQVNRHFINDFTYSNRPNMPEVSIKTDSEAYLHALFANHQTTLFKKLTLNGGLRGNYYSLLENYRVEPRVFANWQLMDQWSLKSSYGLYSQYITQQVYFDFEDTKIENLTWELASVEKPIIKSTQWMVGTIWRPGSFVVDVEFYQKDITDLSILRKGKRPTDPDRFTTGDLSIYGADVLLKKKWNLLDTWISYSYVHTEMTFPELNLASFETYYDQPHTFNVNATLPLRSWSFSVGWQYQSGVPVYTNSTFFPTPGGGQPQPGEPEEPVTAQENEGRFPVQHQLDMAVIYRFPEKPRSWNGSIGLSILNVYDRTNFVAENYLTFGPRTSLYERYSIGFAPNLMVTLRW